MSRLTLTFLTFIIFLVSCKKDEVEPLTASFQWKSLSQGIIQFDVASNSATEYVWDFGEGTVRQSNNTMVIHEYKRNGTYNVRMTARTSDGRSKDVINTIEVSDIPTTGQATFYTTSNNVGGYIEVTVSGTYRGRITSYYNTSSNSTVTCGLTGNVTVTLPGGTYGFTAKSQNGTSWSGFIDIVNGQCSPMRLYKN